jgi:hypothetical protein
MNIRFITSVILTILLLSSFAFGDCEPNWKPGNGPQGVSNYVTALIKWDPDGNGPQAEELIAGGYFSNVCGVAANCAAAWDGNAWKPMGGGLPSYTKVFAVYNGQLFAGGNYGGVYRWNGSNWERMSGSEGFLVYSMTVYNGQLIVGESVSNTGCNLHSWDGNDWHLMSSMTGGTYGPYINALTVYTGELIAGGEFNVAGGVECNRIARWDGTNWHPLGGGMNGTVKAFTNYNNELIIGGGFTSVDGMDINRVVRWDGANYYPMGQGLSGNPGTWWTQDVMALTVYRGKVIAGGGFYKAGDLDVNRIASWDGNSWQPLGSGASVTLIEALVEYNSELIAGGDYSQAGGLTVKGLGRWNGSEWKAFGNGLDGTGGETYVYGMTVYKNELIAGGWFPTAGGLDVNFISRWNGEEWKSLSYGFGGNPNGGGTIYALTVFNNELIAGGNFMKASGVDANRVARWDGNNWQSLGSGLSRPPYYASVRSLTVYNNELIAGGDFNLAGGIEANGVAGWNGSTWHSFGGGIRRGVQGSYGVRALTVYKGQLIAGGDFNVADGVDVNGITRWDGSGWQPLGSGVYGTRFSVIALIDYDGKLIVGGSFSKAGGIDANNIASWDGNSWQPLGGGFSGWVYALTVYNGRLIAGGAFSKTGINRISWWDGNDWQPFGSGTDNIVSAMTNYRGDLIAGGWFTKAGGIPAMRWARWGVPEPIEGDLNHDCVLDLLDLKLFVEQWLNHDCLQTGWCNEVDLNYDSAVDFSDFADFADAY